MASRRSAGARGYLCGLEWRRRRSGAAPLAGYEMLSKLSGEQFDREFAMHMVMDHRKDIAEYRAAATNGSAPDVASLAERHLVVGDELLAEIPRLVALAALLRELAHPNLREIAADRLFEELGGARGALRGCRAGEQQARDPCAAIGECAEQRLRAGLCAGRCGR